MMKRLLQTLALSAALFGSAGVVAAQTWTTALETQLVDAELAYEAALASFEAERYAFERRAEDIDLLKADFDGSPVDTLTLQNSMRELHEMADALMALEAQAALAHETAVALREAMRDELRATIAEREASLVTAAPAERVDIIATLNQLSARLVDMQDPLPDLPSVPLDDILAAATADPDELYATADELLDNAVRIERQLALLEAQLAERDTRARLERTSQQFAAEEAFFEEGQGTRYRDRSPSSREATPTASADEGSNDAPTSDAQELGDVDDGAVAAPVEEGGSRDTPTDEYYEGAADEMPESDDPGADMDFGDNGDDGVLSGGVEVGVDYEAEPIAPAAPELVDTPATPSGTVDPMLTAREDLSDDGVDRRREADPLVAERMRLERELERVQSERARVLREAELMESVDLR